MTTRPWRQEIELVQNYSRHKTFTLTTSGSSAETVLNLSGLMEECNKVSLVVELADAYLEFDGDPSNCNMETDVNCRCPPGFSFIDVDVTNFVKNAGLLGKDGEDITERDRIGYDPTFSLKKGSCRKNNCFCDNGTATEGTRCKNDGDHICELTPCNTGSILKGNPPRCYEAEKDDAETRISQPNCPYSNGESINMGDSSDPENLALFTSFDELL